MVALIRACDGRTEAFAGSEEEDARSIIAFPARLFLFLVFQRLDAVARCPRLLSWTRWIEVIPTRAVAVVMVQAPVLVVPLATAGLRVSVRFLVQCTHLSDGEAQASSFAAQERLPWRRNCGSCLRRIRNTCWLNRSRCRSHARSQQRDEKQGSHGTFVTMIRLVMGASPLPEAFTLRADVRPLKKRLERGAQPDSKAPWL
jgi:hypothetical protein